MQIMSRSEARSAGLKYYFKGVPCGYGHLSERWTADAKCIECNKIRRVVDFKKDPDKYRAWSKAYRTRSPQAQRFARLRRQFGLTVDVYYAMLEEQGNRCAICRTDDPGRNSNWNVDHCHTSGAVRGMLCSNCNTALGLAKDSVTVLKSMIGYLERHADSSTSTKADLLAVSGPVINQ